MKPENLLQHLKERQDAFLRAMAGPESSMVHEVIALKVQAETKIEEGERVSGPLPFKCTILIVFFIARHCSQGSQCQAGDRNIQDPGQRCLGGGATGQGIQPNVSCSSSLRVGAEPMSKRTIQVSEEDGRDSILTDDTCERLIEGMSVKQTNE